MHISLFAFACAIITVNSEGALQLSCKSRLNGTAFTERHADCEIVIEIFSPLTGTIESINEVPDVLFSEKMIGDGVAVYPTGGRIVAPLDGTIGKIFSTNHVFTMDNGRVEIYVQFGVGAEELKGEGFRRVAQEGQQVRVGDTVIEYDIAVVQQKASDILSPIVVTNMDDIMVMEKMTGEAIAGETVALRVTI